MRLKEAKEGGGGSIADLGQHRAERRLQVRRQVVDVVDAVVVERAEDALNAASRHEPLVATR